MGLLVLFSRFKYIEKVHQRGNKVQHCFCHSRRQAKIRDIMTITVYVNFTAEDERNACQGVRWQLFATRNNKKKHSLRKKSLNVIKHSDIH